MQNEYSQSLVFQTPLEPDHHWSQTTSGTPPLIRGPLLAGRAALGGRFGWPLIKRPEKKIKAVRFTELARPNVITPNSGELLPRMASMSGERCGGRGARDRVFDRRWGASS
jgi:hypothetical protein